MSAWEITQPSLSRDDDAVMQRFWGEYRERLDRVRKNVAENAAKNAAFCQLPAARCSEIELRVVRPVRQPAWGGLVMTIAIAVKRIWNGDGHARAERREEAWYQF